MVKKIFVNMMCKSEIFSPLAIDSIAPYVDKVLIHDTGSEEWILHDLYLAKEIYNNIEIVERKLEDAHSWVQANVEQTMNKNVAQALGDIRREQQRISEENGADFILVVDGDEIIPPSLMMQIKELVEQDLYGRQCLYLPFIDFVHDFKNIRHDHLMGRVFRCGTTELLGRYPLEMQHSKLTGKCLELGREETMALHWISDTNSVHHMESLCKPWRKKLEIKRKYSGVLPGILTENTPYKASQIIKKWL